MDLFCIEYNFYTILNKGYTRMFGFPQPNNLENKYFSFYLSVSNKSIK